MPVYFIADDENGDYDNLRIKIGHSKNIEARVAQLSTGSPFRLKLMGWIDSGNDRELEKSLHKKYEGSNSHLEWFVLSVSDILEELKINSVNAYIAVAEDVFEVTSFDRKGIPEYIGAWQWNDDMCYSEFCPSCGWGGGLSYNENHGGERCLKCGFTVN